MDTHIKQLVEKYPNDFELGEKVRQLYWLQQENFFKEIRLLHCLSVGDESFI